MNDIKYKSFKKRVLNDKIFHFMCYFCSLAYNFVMKLQELRIKMGLSQQEFAKKLGVSSTTLYRYENGINEPSIDTLIKMADIFGTSVDNLIGAKTPMLDLKQLDDYQKELIDEILKLSPNKANRVLGYIKSLNEKG